MSKKDERAFLSQLRRVMLHVIKWFTLPSKRSKSWTTSIKNGRKEMKRLQKANPKFNKNFVHNNWEQSFEKAKRGAEKEMNKKSDIENLTEKQVFEDEYKLRNTE